MATYGELQTRIANELNRTDLTSEIQAAIQRAIREFRYTRFRFNTGYKGTTTADGVEFYPLPNDLIDVDLITLIDGTDRIPLEQRSNQWVETNRTTTYYTGLPYIFAIVADTLRLYPVPDDTYTLRMFCLKELGGLSDNADENTWTSEGQDLITLRAKVILLREVIRGAESIAEANEIEGTPRRPGPLSREFKRLKIALAQQEATGRIEPGSPLLSGGWWR